MRENTFCTLIYFSDFIFLKEMSVFLKLKFILLLFPEFNFRMLDYLISDQKDKFRLIWS